MTSNVVCYFTSSYLTCRKHSARERYTMLTRWIDFLIEQIFIGFLLNISKYIFGFLFVVWRWFFFTLLSHTLTPVSRFRFSGLLLRHILRHVFLFIRGQRSAATADGSVPWRYTMPQWLAASYWFSLTLSIKIGLNDYS